MSLKEEVKSLVDLEQKIKEKVLKINESLAQEISANPMEGVNVHEGKVLCATVSSKAIFGSPNMILEPSYYIPASQAQAVKARLENCRTIQSTCNAVKQMLDEKKVRIGTTVTRLNEKTLQVLKDSELANLFD